MYNKTVLITGSTGFVGQNVTKKLLEEDYLVYVIVRNVNKLLKKFKSRYVNNNLFPIEIKHPEEKDYKFYFELLKKHNINVVIHMAALSREYNEISFDEYMKVNVNFTKNLYQGLKYSNESDSSTFIFVSTAGVYGTIPQQCPASENSILRPNGKYHLSKKIAEDELQHLSKDNNKVRLIILRPIIMYGYHDFGFLYKIFKLHRKRIFPLVENVKWHLLDVEFFRDIVSIAIENKKINGIYNVADEKPVKSRDLLDFIAKLQKGGYIRVPAYAFNIINKILPITYKIKIDLISKSWYYDVSKLKKDFHVVPPDTLQNLKKKYLKWYLSR